MARISVACLLSALVDLAIWSARSTELSGHINVLGNVSFNNFDPGPLYLKYRLITYAFPVGVIVFYLLLERWGPLRSATSDGRRRGVRAAELETGSGPDRLERADWQLSRLLWMLVPPALFLGVVAGVANGGKTTHVGVASFVVAALYPGFVLLLARLAHGLKARSKTGTEWPWESTLATTSAASTAFAAIGSVWFVSLHTHVRLANGHIQGWSWLPWWLAAVGVAAAWAWIASSIKHGASPDTVEHRIRVLLLGSAATFLAVSALPGPLPSFQGYDDAIPLAGAHLTQGGYFPWRDILFDHGFFPDAVVPLINFKIFGESAWGSAAANDLIWAPLTWVGIYLLGAWAVRKRSAIVAAPIALAAAGTLAIDPRFVAFPFILLLLGKELTSRRLRWTCLLTTAVFAQAIWVPESSFQVLAVLIVIVVSDAVHRKREDSLAVSFRRTICMVATGATLTVALAVFLASQHALSSLVEWYLVLLPSHVAEGALSPNGVPATQLFLFRLMVVLVIGTVLWAAWQIRYRANWTSKGWVTFTAAITAGLYGEQALGRFDTPHVVYSNIVGLLLIVLVGVQLVPQADRLLRPRDARLLHAPVTLCLAVLGFVLMSLAQDAWKVPNKTRLAITTNGPQGRLGYTRPKAVPAALLTDLRTVLRTYAAPHAPFFDMTNSEGYFYFLLGQRPASRFVNVSMALTEYGQRRLVQDLAKSRPPLIAFNSTTTGLPVWDDVENQVRHFEVSQYILDHWKPLVVTDGLLFMLRNDLMASRPHVPHLITKPETRGLYGSQPACNWGDAANYLQSRPSGRSITLAPRPVTGVTQVGVSGWAFDKRKKARAREVVVMVGDHVGTVAPLTVASAAAVTHTHDRSAYSSGFDTGFATGQSGPISVYALLSDGRLHELPGGQPGSPNLRQIRLPDGHTYRVGSGGSGQLTGLVETPAVMTKFQLPRSYSPSSFQLATFRAKGAIGKSALTLGNSKNFDDAVSQVNQPSAVWRATPNIPINNDIIANTLPISGSSMSVRVGSCLAWHGYRGHTLYVAQTGGTPISSLTLSGVGS